MAAGYPAAIDLYGSVIDPWFFGSGRGRKRGNWAKMRTSGAFPATYRSNARERGKPGRSSGNPIPAAYLAADRIGWGEPSG